MTRTASGAVTIYDVADGIHPLSMVLSNQAHSFAADNEGVVAAAEKGQFSCELFVYVGGTRCVVDTNTFVFNTYRLGTITYSTSGWVVIATEASGQYKITATTIPGGTTNRTVVAKVPVTIVNAVGNETVVDGIISLSKAIEGADGQAVYLAPSRQTFQYNEDRETTDGNIVIDVSTVGITGVLSATYATNGSSSFSELVQGASVNQASVVDIDGTGTDTITLTKVNFGVNNVMAIRVTGATGGSDTVSIIRIQDGATGAASLFVSISSSVNGFVFKNNTGPAKTLTVKVIDMKNGNVVTPSAFQWYKNGSSISGETTATLSVTATDIADNSSEEYSCTVTLAGSLFDVPQTEMDALAAFYTATDGDNWTDNTGWNGDVAADMLGVTVSDGHVTKVELVSNNLIGAAGATLDPLSDSLTSLYCQYNSISTLDVSALTSLARLNCRDNNMIEAEVDNILCGLDTVGAINGALYIHGTNDAPSATGLACEANLEADGWDVTVTGE